MSDQHATRQSRSTAIVSGAVGLVMLGASAVLLREFSETAFGLVAGGLLAIWGLGALGFGLASLLGLVHHPIDRGDRLGC
jgi:hypothetical protein